VGRAVSERGAQWQPIGHAAQLDTLQPPQSRYSRKLEKYGLGGTPARVQGTSRFCQNTLRIRRTLNFHVKEILQDQRSCQGNHLDGFTFALHVGKRSYQDQKKSEMQTREAPRPLFLAVRRPKQKVDFPRRVLAGRQRYSGARAPASRMAGVEKSHAREAKGGDEF